MAGLRIAAVMAVHNRRDLTLACPDSLRAQQLLGGTLDVFVLDDATTEDRAAAIVELHPDAWLLRGDGQLYWNGGMRRPFSQAMAVDYDYYLWMNDDTKHDDAALQVSDMLPIPTWRDTQAILSHLDSGLCDGRIR
jgi:GT2 family glycosyltransferase